MLMIVLRVLAVLVGVALIARYSRAPEGLFFFPSREPFDAPPGARDVWFTSADGVRLHGWILLPRGASAESRVPAVLHVHGNAGNIGSHVAFSEFLPDAGVGVLIFDYRSYGKSDPAPGRLRREALLADTRAAWKALKDIPEVDPSRLGIYGVSIGCTFASALASESPDARCLCLAAPFASWPGIAQAHMPLLGPALVVSGLDPADEVKKLGDRPLLVVHGQDDTVVPMAQGRAVADAAEQAGVHTEFAGVGDAGHNNLIADEAVGRGIVSAFFVRELHR